jgi:hypothetical protein
MPIYVYKDEHGHAVELVRSVSERDNAPAGFRRVTAPQSIFVANGAMSPIDMKTNVMKGYYKDECENGSRRKSSYTPKQIKAAWGS